MNDILLTLETQLLNQQKICTVPQLLHAFPQTFYEPFQYAGIGYIVCTHGQFSFMIDNDTFTVRSGETFFLPNDKAFRIIKHSHNLGYHILLFEVEPIRDILNTTVMSLNLYHRFTSDTHYAWRTGREADLIHYVALINSCTAHAQGNFTDYEQTLLTVSVTYCLCSIYQQKILTGQPNKASAINMRKTEVFLKLIQLVETHYMNERGVEFYADKLCLSPKYLSALSKSISGYTVQDLVFKAIIRRSKTLLCITNKTIQEISNDFNFPNASSFGTFFKKQTGMSPMKYREIGLKDNLKQD